MLKSPAKHLTGVTGMTDVPMELSMVLSWPELIRVLVGTWDPPPPASWPCPGSC